MAAADSAVHGVLNLLKPAGPTSHDCVSRVRRVLRTRRAGHAGTLDPMASGVLVIGVGNGTRVLEYFHPLPKQYRARILFGVETDTQDTTGRVTAERDASRLSEERVRQAIAAFAGDILQVPPMVSAVKVRGRRLHELARRGETVEREARPVTLYAVHLLAFTPGPRAEAEVRLSCSAGTYVRTLCHDLGAELGTGAAMSALCREAVGPFRVEDAVPLDDLRPDTLLIPLAEALAHLPAFTVDPDDAVRLAQGQFIAVPDAAPDGPARALDPAGRLLAVVTVRGHGDSRLASPEKVFVTTDAARHRD
jgi:tRNA pseudouridine55 synthase